MVERQTPEIGLWRSLIIENVQDINPSNENGETPLGLATRNGYFEICKLFIENIVCDIHKLFIEKEQLLAPNLEKRLKTWSKSKLLKVGIQFQQCLVDEKFGVPRKFEARNWESQNNKTI